MLLILSDVLAVVQSGICIKESGKAVKVSTPEPTGRGRKVSDLLRRFYVDFVLCSAEKFRFFKAIASVATGTCRCEFLSKKSTVFAHSTCYNLIFD